MVLLVYSSTVVDMPGKIIGGGPTYLAACPADFRANFMQISFTEYMPTLTTNCCSLYIDGATIHILAGKIAT